MATRHTDVVFKFYEAVIERADHDAAEHLLAPEVVIHDPMQGTARGLAAFHQMAELFRTAFPEQQVRIEQVVTEGDFVAVLHTHQATNTGPFLGKPPTGKTVAVSGIELFRLREGRIVEFWRHDDDAGLMRQLGLLPG